MRSAELFKKVREAKGIKQAEIADKSGLSRPAMARFEAGTLMLSDEKLAIIAKLVDINPDYFQGITQNAFKSQSGELIKFLVNRYHAHDDLLIANVINSSKNVDIFALSPPLTVLERIRHLNLVNNPLYAMLIRDDIGNLFLFRCKFPKEFMSEDLNIAAMYESNAKRRGIGVYREAQVVNRNLYDKLFDWNDINKEDIQYLIDDKDNNIRNKSITLNDTEKILNNTIRDNKLDPIAIDEMLNCMLENNCKPENITKFILQMEKLKIDSDEVVRILAEYKQ